MSDDDFDNQYLMAKEEEKKDVARYLEIITELAEKGHAKSQIELGSLYLGGFEGVERSVDSALEWFLEAEISEAPENYYLLGMLFEPGFDGPNKSFEADKEKSNKYYKMAFWAFLKQAKNGDVKSMYRVSEMYLSGLGVIKDDKESKEWKEKYISSRNASLTRQI